MTAGSVLSTNDGDGESHHQHARDGAHPAHHLAQRGDGGDVAIPDSRHGDQSPPVGVKHGVELCSRGAVLLKHKRQRGEDQDLRDVTLLERHFIQLAYPDGEEENEQAEFFIALSEGVAETLEASGVSGQLEDPDDPHDPEKLSNPPHLHQVSSHVLPDQGYAHVVTEMKCSQIVAPLS